MTSALCRVLAENAGYDEAAFWCDVRGKHSIPKHYTGNVGCYWHEPLCVEGEDNALLAERLYRSLHEGGGRKIAETYATMKKLGSDGGRVSWTGTRPGVLPINLVPFPTALADFGHGGPVLMRMLTRNVHGLRIYRSLGKSHGGSGGADGAAGFVVEACLPREIRQKLGGWCSRVGMGIRELCSDP